MLNEITHRRFPHWDDDLTNEGLVVLPADRWKDVTTDGDHCPVFKDTVTGLMLWVDFAEPLRRVLRGEPRFILARTRDVDDTICECDDWTVVQRHIDEETSNAED